MYASLITRKGTLQEYKMFTWMNVIFHHIKLYLYLGLKISIFNEGQTYEINNKKISDLFFKLNYMKPVSEKI